MLALARVAISSSSGVAARLCGVIGTIAGAPSRNLHLPNVEKPKPGTGRSFRRIVHYPDKYTVKPLEVTNLAGRDPVTGRIVAKGIGGGIKHKYHWIQFRRLGPKNGPPLEEKVLEVLDDGCRTAKIALVGYQDKLKYIIATENMKAGDIIRSSRHIPRIPVRPNEGDSYPLGALPVGTIVCSVEEFPGGGGKYMHAAGTFGTILRKQEDKVIVKMASKHDFCFDQKCVAVVGRVSNILHGSTPIGSAQRNRWLGNRPRSGLWKRKDGRHGRKIRPPRKVKVLVKTKKTPKPLELNMYV